MDDNDEESGDDGSYGEKMEDKESAKVVVFILKAIFAWKAFFMLSDVAVSFILHSFNVILQTISAFCQSSRLSELLLIFPKTIYLARKWLKLNTDDFTKFVVCPSCYSLHDYKETLAKAKSTGSKYEYSY